MARTQKPAVKNQHLVITFNKQRLFLAIQHSDATAEEFAALIYGYVMGLGNGWDSYDYTDADVSLPIISFYD